MAFFSFDLERDFLKGKHPIVESLSSASCDGKVGNFELGDRLTGILSKLGARSRFLPTGSYPPVSVFCDVLLGDSTCSVLSGWLAFL